MTGATSGIGKALAADLGRTGETVVIVARDAERGKATLDELSRLAQSAIFDLAKGSRDWQPRKGSHQSTILTWTKTF